MIEVDLAVVHVGAEDVRGDAMRWMEMTRASWQVVCEKGDFR
jgi:hypothetical protein